jgi:hypothetical protein
MKTTIQNSSEVSSSSSKEEGERGMRADWIASLCHSAAREEAKSRS